MPTAICRLRLIFLVCLLLSGPVHAGVLEPRLQALAATPSAPAPRATVPSAPNMRVPRVDDLGRVQVYVHVAPSGVLTPTAAVLQGLGAVRLVSSKSLGVVQAWVPVTALETLAAAPGVNRVSLPSYVRPRRPVHAQAVSPRIASTTASVSIPSGLAIDAGGLLDMRATGLIVNGMRGAGVKVGVISGDNAGLGASQAAGYLPATVWSDP